MKRYLLLLWVMCTLTLSAQMRQEQTLTWEDFVQEFLSDVEDSGSLTGIEEELDRLEYISLHPMQLNRMSRSDLLQLPFLNEAQVDSLLSYRQAKHGFLSLGELQLVRGMDYFTRRYLQLFVRCDSTVLPSSEWLELRRQANKVLPKLHRGKHEIEVRTDIPLYRRDGYEKPDKPTPTNYYVGKAWSQVVRYRYNFKREVAYGFTMNKDAGEPVAKQGFYPYDYLSGYLFIKPRGRRWSFVLGDYEIRGGRGLLFGRQFYGGRDQLLQSFQFRSTTFRPHTSTDEIHFFRGVAAAYSWKQFSVMAFASYRKLDGRYEEGTDTVRSLLQTGMHRTLSEISRRRNVGNVTAGINASWSGLPVSLAIDAYLSHYDHPICPTPRIYNRYRFHGQTAGGVSLSYHFKSGKLSMQGELATDHHMHLATEHVLHWQQSKRLQFFAQGRHLGYNFVSIYGDALQQASRVANEQGLMLGTRLQPARLCELTAYVDVFRYPKETFTTVLPGARGLEASLQAKIKVSAPWMFMARYRIKTRQRTITGYKQLEYRTLHRIRLAALYANRQFSLTAQADATCAKRQTGKCSLGAMASARATWKVSKRYRLKAFTGLFFTDDYESAVYAYEPQLFRAGAFPSFAYHGVRAVVVNEWSVLRNLMLGVRMSGTRYFNRDEISSGLARIASAWKNDLSVQLRWRMS